ncbi:YetF domain-containing protein [Psychrobacter sp.]|uniref:DUF421 domain-containing protein n=1 Tax=Psychrobacter sp. TaxID=56811 RepID=UPI0025F03B62|nr:YetF domain-containing protein [Psychrobacter sp.]
MDWSKWLFIDWEVALAVVLSATAVYFALIFYTRIMGLRSFAKLSSYDFAMTVAMGSILASTILSKSPALLKGLLAIAILFLLQGCISVIRRKSTVIRRLVDNQPIVLMAHGEFNWDNIKEAKMSKNDLQEVLRKNGIKSTSEVFAMVMETTGDMSVIKTSDTPADIEIFDDIRDYELIVHHKNFK